MKIASLLLSLPVARPAISFAVDDPRVRGRVLVPLWAVGNSVSFPAGGTTPVVVHGKRDGLEVFKVYARTMLALASAIRDAVVAQVVNREVADWPIGKLEHETVKAGRLSVPVRGRDTDVSARPSFQGGDNTATRSFSRVPEDFVNMFLNRRNHDPFYLVGGAQ